MPSNRMQYKHIPECRSQPRFCCITQSRKIPTQGAEDPDVPAAGRYSARRQMFRLRFELFCLKLYRRKVVLTHPLWSPYVTYAHPFSRAEAVTEVPSGIVSRAQESSVARLLTVSP